jgi:hypothetical protein
MEHVEFITTESGDDLIVSFALSQGEPGEIRSLILLRTPKYEIFFDEFERGVSFSDEDCMDEEDRLRSIEILQNVIHLRTLRRDYILDIHGIDRKELKRAEKVLRKMNFDHAFELRIS